MLKAAQAAQVRSGAGGAGAAGGAGGAGAEGGAGGAGAEGGAGGEGGMTPADTDMDGIVDAADNCPMVANEDRRTLMKMVQAMSATMISMVTVLPMKRTTVHWLPIPNRGMWTKTAPETHVMTTPITMALPI